MNSMRRATILKMAAAASEMELEVLSGVLSQDRDGHWRIGEQPLVDWFAKFQDQELVVLLGSLEDDRPVEVRTCHTCGRDYQDLECPYCRESRFRLRGHA